MLSVFVNIYFPFYNLFYVNIFLFVPGDEGGSLPFLLFLTFFLLSIFFLLSLAAP